MRSDRSQGLSAVLRRLGCLLALWLLAAGGQAQLTSPGGLLQGRQPLQASTVLPAEDAFRLTTLVAGGSLRLTWQIAADHYLYRDKFALAPADGQPLALVLPEAVQLTDEFFGATAVYFDSVQLAVPLEALSAADRAAGFVTVHFQGCAKELYCYPPQQLQVPLQSAR